MRSSGQVSRMVRKFTLELLRALRAPTLPGIGSIHGSAHAITSVRHAKSSSPFLSGG